MLLVALQLLILIALILIHFLDLVLHALEDALHKFSRLLLFNTLFFFAFDWVGVREPFQELVIGADFIIFRVLSNSLPIFSGLRIVFVYFSFDSSPLTGHVQLLLLVSFLVGNSHGIPHAHLLFQTVYRWGASGTLFRWYTWRSLWLITILSDRIFFENIRWLVVHVEYTGTWNVRHLSNVTSDCVDVVFLPDFDRLNFLVQSTSLLQELVGCQALLF